MTTITTTADALARAYFGTRATGTVRAPAGLSSEGRPVHFISITRGSHYVTLTGQFAGRKWNEVYPPNAVRIDD